MVFDYSGFFHFSQLFEKTTMNTIFKKPKIFHLQKETREKKHMDGVEEKGPNNIS